MPNLFKGVVKLTEDQYKTLLQGGSFEVDGQTITYDENTLYVTDYSIDGELNVNSLNPVTNKAIATAIENLKGTSTLNGVTIDTDQDISGNKNFTGEVTKNGVNLATVEQVPIVSDSLNAQYRDNALSVNQGIILNDKITTLMENVNGRVQSFSIANLEELGILFNINTSEIKDEYAVGSETITYKDKEYTLKTGDIFLIVDVNVPDYWFSLDDMKLFKLETSKVDLTKYVDTETDQTIDGNKTFSNQVIATNGIKVATDQSAINTKGVVFGNNVARIGTNNAGGLGVFANDEIVLRAFSSQNQNGGLKIYNGSFYPNQDSFMNIGGSSNKFKDLYLSGNLNDGTNSIAIKDIASKSSLSGLATEEYVRENGGKIDKIKVNGVEQTITDKVANLVIDIPEPETITDYYKVKNKLSAVDLNTVVVPGNYGVVKDCGNMPVAENGTLFVGNYDNNQYAQQIFVAGNNTMYIRSSTSIDNSTWSSWESLAKDSKFAQYVKLDDDVYEFADNLYNSSKNLFDKNNPNILEGVLVHQNNKALSENSPDKTLYIPITGGKTYTVSKLLTSRFAVGTSVTFPRKNLALLQVIQRDAYTTATITTESSANYLCVHYYRSTTDTLTEQEILNSIQIEEGGSSTSYQNYNDSRHITDDEALFLKKQWKKSANLYKPFVNCGSIETLGLTVTMNDDGTFTLNGTPTNDRFIEITYKFGNGTNPQTNKLLSLDNGTYTGHLHMISGDYTPKNDIAFWLQTGNTESIQTKVPINQSVIFKNVDGIYRGYFKVLANTTFTNLKLGFMFYLGTGEMPYQSNNSSAHIENLEAKLLKEEWKKSANLYDNSKKDWYRNGDTCSNLTYSETGISFDVSGAYGSAGVYLNTTSLINKYGLIENKLYTFIFDYSISNSNFEHIRYSLGNSSKTDTGKTTGRAIICANLVVGSALTIYLRTSSFTDNFPHVDITNIMLIEGNVEIGNEYLKNNGPIIHKNDLGIMSGVLNMGPNYIQWKENNFGDGFRIVPQFIGSVAANYLSIFGYTGDEGEAIGANGNKEIARFHAHSGDIEAFGKLNVTEQLTSLKGVKIGSENSAMNDVGIIFESGNRIGSSQNLGFYSNDGFYFRPSYNNGSVMDEGIAMYATEIYPTKSGRISLGISQNKFKDLYLSGTMYGKKISLDINEAAAMVLSRKDSEYGVYIDYYAANQTEKYSRVGNFGDHAFGVSFDGSETVSFKINRDRKLVKDDTYTYTLPNKTGTVALTSDLSNYTSFMKCGSTSDNKYYTMFARTSSSNASGNVGATMLVSGVGQFGGTQTGTWLVEVSNRGSKPTMKVKCLNANNSGTVTFGYYIDSTNGYFYFGAYCPSYRGDIAITILRNTSVTIQDFGDSTTTPSGWTTISTENFVTSSESVASATKATQDGNGNIITNSYVASVSRSQVAISNPTTNMIAYSLDFKNKVGTSLNSYVYNTYLEATTSLNGLMTAADKTKLNNLSNMVTLTQAQYDALATKDANTYYFIKEE